MTGLTDEQKARERSMIFAIVLDSFIGSALFIAGILGGSLTVLAEAIRGTLGQFVEMFSLLVLRGIHRGQVAEFEFGAGKLEQVCNLAIAVSMLAGAGWVSFHAIGVLLYGHTASPVGLALGASFGALNTFLNFIAWDEVRQACRGSASVIMRAQLTSRRTKLISSCAVQITLTVAALARDPMIAGVADGGGALFVSAYMTYMARQMLRHGLPDILDRSLDEASQIAMLRVLAAHFDAYDQLLGLRTRRSGTRVFIEITLGFAADLTLAELRRRTDPIKAAIARELETADVSILFVPCPNYPLVGLR
jgi:cation diffusion facilitator family transporter